MSEPSNIPAIPAIHAHALGAGRGNFRRVNTAHTIAPVPSANRISNKVFISVRDKI